MNTKKIKVLLADDHSVVRMGLAALLKYQDGIEVVGEAEDGEEAVRQARALKPDVLVTDLMMPKLDGAAVTKAVRAALPETKVLILTTFGTSADMSRAVANGASGALMKDASNDALVDAIRAVAEGKNAFSPEIEQFVREEPDIPPFTARQQEILHSVTRGLTNAEIARQFGISVDGVKRHCLVIFKKLGAANRSEAAAIAIRRQLLKS